MLENCWVFVDLDVQLEGIDGVGVNGCQVVDQVVVGVVKMVGGVVSLINVVVDDIQYVGGVVEFGFQMDQV